MRLYVAILPNRSTSMRVEFPATNYMFCRPENSQPQVRMWRHLMCTSNLELVIDTTPQVRLRLMYQYRTLEECPKTNIKVIRRDSHYAFKWHSEQGVFRFQLKILDGEDQLTILLQQLGITVTYSEASSPPEELQDFDTNAIENEMGSRKHIPVRWISRAFVEPNRSIRWEHLGRVSGLILSLNDSRVVISWNEKVFESFKLDNKRFKAYYAEEIVGLKERRDNMFFHLQLRVNSEAASFVCNWLEQKGIDLENSGRNRGEASYAGTTRLTSGWDENPYP